MPPLKKILIIDDETDLLEVVQIRLEASGYKVFVAASGEEGIVVGEKEKPDLIFLDLMMPGMDGYQTCVEFKKKEATKAIPIILLSARTQPKDQQTGFDAGACDYIIKPFEVPDILAKIKKHIG